MSLQKIIFFLFLCCLPFLSKAKLVSIGVFDAYKVQSILIKAHKGSYNIFTDQGKIYVLQGKDQLRAELTKSGKIKIILNDSVFGIYRQINFIANDNNGQFSIQPVKPLFKERIYDDNLILRKKFYYSEILMINNVSFENYLAGVVQAEVGKRPPSEYFKLQSIICRTYALKNRHRHQEEGFNLCDRVHCQAYHGRATSNKIIEAVRATKNLVVVDSNINYILAAFSSNCGGETSNSQDVWNKKLYYLQSVKDTFCINSSHAHWKKIISFVKWKKYLSNHLKCNYRQSADKKDSCFSYFTQTHRMVNLICRNCKLNLREVRQNLQLNSTFFNITREGNKMILTGRGFGHGIGLCQEGAIEMSKDDYDYPAIINHYYTGVFIIKRRAIALFKEQ